MESYSVIIVGAGLAGLTTATALGRYNVSTLLVERRTGTLLHPRADGFTPRTVEIFRSLGLSSADVPEKPAGFQLRRARIESLTGKWFEELAWSAKPETESAPTPAPPNPEYSPYRGATMPQDQLEPVLLERAAKLGVKIALNHEFVEVEQHSEKRSYYHRSRPQRHALQGSNAVPGRRGWPPQFRARVSRHCSLRPWACQLNQECSLPRTRAGAVPQERNQPVYNRPARSQGVR